jgi:hypothetical protein
MLINEIFTYTQSDVQTGISTRDLLAVASRAGEYKAVSHIQRDGGNLSDCVFSPPMLIHSEMDSKGFERLNKSLAEKYKQQILLNKNKNRILATILTEHHYVK